MWELSQANVKQARNFTKTRRSLKCERRISNIFWMPITQGRHRDSPQKTFFHVRLASTSLSLSLEIDRPFVRGDQHGNGSSASVLNKRHFRRYRQLVATEFNPFVIFKIAFREINVVYYIHVISFASVGQMYSLNSYSISIRD